MVQFHPKWIKSVIQIYDNRQESVYQNHNAKKNKKSNQVKVLAVGILLRWLRDVSVSVEFTLEPNQAKPPRTKTRTRVQRTSKVTFQLTEATLDLNITSSTISAVPRRSGADGGGGTFWDSWITFDVFMEGKENKTNTKPSLGAQRSSPAKQKVQSVDRCTIALFRRLMKTCSKYKYDDLFRSIITKYNLRLLWRKSYSLCKYCLSVCLENCFHWVLCNIHNEAACSKVRLVL